MFKRMYRLRGNIRFEKPFVFQSNIFFTLRLKENMLTQNRFGFVVSKRVDKRATVRNRSKRILRSIVEAKANSLKPGYDMVFSVKKVILAKERSQVEKLVLSIFQAEKLLV